MSWRTILSKKEHEDAIPNYITEVYTKLPADNMKKRIAEAVTRDDETWEEFKRDLVEEGTSQDLFIKSIEFVKRLFSQDTIDGGGGTKKEYSTKGFSDSPVKDDALRRLNDFKARRSSVSGASRESLDVDFRKLIDEKDIDTLLTKLQRTIVVESKQPLLYPEGEEKKDKNTPRRFRAFLKKEPEYARKLLTMKLKDDEKQILMIAFPRGTPYPEIKNFREPKEADVSKFLEHLLQNVSGNDKYRFINEDNATSRSLKALFPSGTKTFLPAVRFIVEKDAFDTSALRSRKRVGTTNVMREKLFSDITSDKDVPIEIKTKYEELKDKVPRDVRSTKEYIFNQIKNDSELGPILDRYLEESISTLFLNVVDKITELPEEEYKEILEIIEDEDVIEFNKILGTEFTKKQLEKYIEQGLLEQARKPLENPFKQDEFKENVSKGRISKVLDASSVVVALEKMADLFVSGEDHLDTFDYVQGDIDESELLENVEKEYKTIRDAFFDEVKTTMVKTLKEGTKINVKGEPYLELVELLDAKE